MRGYAWGANIGWVNFETHGNPRLDLLTGIFSGFAWSANVGWLSFGDPAFHATATTLAITDTDGDGISDAWEMEAAGNLTTLSHNGDADGDGVCDFDEYLADTDPLDATDRLRITRYDLNPGGAPTQMLQFTSHATRLYRIETRLALDSGVWADAGPGPFLGSPGTTLLDLGAAAGPQRFYRVTAQRPLTP